jgi:hypothetical protein
VPVSFEPLEALEVLARHDVRFIVVGIFAAQLRGSAMLARSLEICPARDLGNLERLRQALRDLRARIRRGSKIEIERMKPGDHLEIETAAGTIDILAVPYWIWRGYDELDRVADEMEIRGFTVRVASVDDLIRLGRGRGRPEDLVAVENLGALRDEIDSRAAEERRRRRKRG